MSMKSFSKLLFLGLFLSLAFCVQSCSDDDFGDSNNGGVGDYAYVDLGLPSGTLWATTNVGAVFPADYGDYFAWGETTPKSNYVWSTYKYGLDPYELTKYNWSSYYGTVDNKTQLETSDDAATANWGNDWCMPTKTQQAELRNNIYTIWTRTTQTNSKGESINGYRIVSKSNGNSIFLPATGCREGTSFELAGESGFYWSSSLCSDSPDLASFMYFFSDSGWMDWGDEDRCDGFSVRPVRASAQN